MKSYLKYLILLIAHFQILYSQKWIENDVTDFFKFKYVSDVCFQKDVAWILTGKGLYKYKNGIFENYRIDTLVSGPIEQYKLGKKELINDQFSSMVCNDSILWILATHGKVILKIQNDSITNYKPEFLKNRNYGFYDYCIDENGNLWFQYSVKDTTQKDEYFGYKEIYKIAYFNGVFFSDYPIPEQLSKNVFTSFIINKDILYFTGHHIKKDRYEPSVYLYILNNSKLDSIKLGSNPILRPSFYIYNDSIFIYSSNDKINIIFNDKIIDSVTLTNIGLSFKTELLALNEFIFVTSGNGLYIYNKNDKNHKITKPYDFDDNCLSDFDAIRYNEISNQLWCLYGGAYITDRYDYCHYGLSIYQLK